VTMSNAFAKFLVAASNESENIGRRQYGPDVKLRFKLFFDGAAGAGNPLSCCNRSGYWMVANTCNGVAEIISLDEHGVSR
jgi:hypothetical protein